VDVSTVDKTWDMRDFKGLRISVRVVLRFGDWGVTMSSYLRPRAPGASIFFTVTLADRRSRLLVDKV